MGIEETKNKSKIATQEDNEQEWDFKLDSPAIKTTKNNEKLLNQSKKIFNKVSNELKIDDSENKSVKTRTAMAKEMQRDQDEVLEDKFNLAAIPKRIIAFVLDGFLYGVIYLSVNILSVYLTKLVVRFLDQRHYKMLLPDIYLNKLMLISLLFIIAMTIIIIPLSFYNTSFGKKICKLRVRGKDQYTISVTDAFKREFIFKPIGIALIIGFITPFFSKMRLSLQDMLANTFVVED